jgi:Icc-related predicted phosphoesterase
MMNALLVADYHEYKIDEKKLREVIGGKSVDLIISCGDVPYDTLRKLKERFYDAPMYAVHGNHCPSAPFPEPIVDLHLNVVKKGTLLISGFEGTLRYKESGNYLYNDIDVEQLMGRMPPVDVMISHAPPRGIHDGEDFAHIGFEYFRNYIDEKKPRFWIHGHSHIKNAVTPINDTFVVSVYGFKFVRLETALPEPKAYEI